MLIAQRPHKRDDGVSTRHDRNYWTKPEISISLAMATVEQAGASPALTDAINLLATARERIADHVEALPEAQVNILHAQKYEKNGQIYTQEQLDAAVAQAVDRDRITNFLLFAKNLPEGPASLVYGTNLSAKAIARALEKAGYQ